MRLLWLYALGSALNLVGLAIGIAWGWRLAACFVTGGLVAWWERRHERMEANRG